MKPIQHPVAQRVETPINKQALELAVAEPLANQALGTSVGFVAADARTKEVLISREASARIPASTTKVLTAWAALGALGPDHQFETQVRREGDTLFLVGGGDPYLVAKPSKASWNGTSLEKLASDAATAMGKRTIKLAYDDSLFTGPELNPTWGWSLVPRIVEPVTALNARRELEYTRTPSADTAEVFKSALETKGLVVSEVSARKVPEGAELVASGSSAPLDDIATFMLETSDNTGAEVLLRHVAIAKNKPASFEGGVAALRSSLDEASLPTANLKLFDGSGLSRSNQISPTLLVELLGSTIDSDQFGALVTGMPVSGLSGSLAERFGFAPDAQGVVRAKTGTLTGVSSLAGWANLPDGRTIVFAIMADQINGYPLGAPQEAVDQVAAAIATCAC